MVSLNLQLKKKTKRFKERNHEKNETIMWFCPLLLFNGNVMASLKLVRYEMSFLVLLLPVVASGWVGGRKGE